MIFVLAYSVCAAQTANTLTVLGRNPFHKPPLTSEADLRAMVGYFQSEEKMYLQVPMLEHVAHADERGDLDPVLRNAATIGDGTLRLPSVNVHAFNYDKGRHTLEMIGTGSYVILGLVPMDAKIPGADRYPETKAKK